MIIRMIQISEMPRLDFFDSLVSNSPTPQFGACYIRKKQKPKVIAKSMTYTFCFLGEVETSAAFLREV